MSDWGVSVRWTLLATWQRQALIGALGCALLAMLGSSVAEAAKKVDSLFPVDGVSSGLGGHFNTPRDLVPNRPSLPAQPQDNWIYVADASNHRIQAFDVDGDFQLAIGRDVVAPGGLGNLPNNEVQTVTLSGATGGTFTLRLGGASNPTVPIAYDASAATVQSALEGSTAIGAGNVQVGGAAAGPWTVEFVGALADRDVTQLSGQNAGLTGTTPTVTTATTVPGANGAEICTIEAQCKAGVAGIAGGMFSNPQGIDIDQTSGTLYVRDAGNQRVQQLTAAGGFVKAWGADVDLPAGGSAFEVCASAPNCRAGVSSGNAGAFASASDAATGIAVVPTGLPNSGNVIVADPSNRRILEFDPDAPVPADVFVRGWGFEVVPPTAPTGRQLEICTAATTCQAGVAPTINDAPTPTGWFANNRPDHLAIDANGIVYATNRMVDPAQTFGSALRRVDRFDSTEGLVGDLALSHLPPFSGGTNSSTSLHALETDQENGLLYVSSNVGGVAGNQSVKEYDLSVEPPVVTDTHLAGSGLTPNGIGVNPSLGTGTGTLYISSTSLSAHRIYALDDDGNPSPPVVTLDPVANVTAHEATLSGTVNPSGFPTSYRFQYSKNGIDWTDVTAAQAIGNGTADVPIGPVTVEGLQANTLYRVRVLVTRGFGNGDVASSEDDFVTDAPAPEVTTLPVNHRGATTATLAGEVNPNGNATSYYFEYGPTTLYGTKVPTPDGDAGSGGTTKQLTEPIAGLQPGATYHYRIVAENVEGKTFGEDVVFTTRSEQSSGSTARGYELVSPAEKIGGGGVGRFYPGDLGAAAVGFASADGERFIAHGQWGSILLDGQFAYANDWAFAERISDGEGWRAHSPATRPNYGPAGTRFANIGAVSDDLSLAIWHSNAAHIKLFPEIEAFPQGTRVPYLGDWQGRYEVFAPTNFNEQGNPGDDFKTVSDDGSHALLTTRPAQQGPLTGGDSDGFNGGLVGPGDPYRADTGEWLSGSAVYIDDASDGLEDAFPGDPEDRAAVGVCDAGTQIPARVEVPPASGNFELSAQSCPDPVEYQPGQFRDGALVSKRGAAAITITGVATTARKNVISSDGSRTFFMSPDPASADPDGPGPLTSGTGPCGPGTGAATSCPTQLYVRHRDADGDVGTRWVSRSEVAGQDASLAAQTLYEGASNDGDKVFFRTNSPLTTDDPNGTAQPTPNPSPETTPGDNSWDLYMYDFTDDPGDDPGAGDLTRISRGPTDAADGNVTPSGGGGALRFASDDGSRVYFTSAAPLPGVPEGPEGGSTAPAGTPTTTATTNLYLYDANRPVAERYQFVALLPRSGNGIASCASTAVAQGLVLNASQAVGTNSINAPALPFSCLNGTPDGAYITFFTGGQLAAGDPDASSGDVYGYDADAHDLARLSAPQGGAGGSYPCVYDLGHPSGEIINVQARCHGDGGRGDEGSLARVPLGVVTDPTSPGDRVAFFQSKSRLVPDDGDDEYDVYQWRNGELSLLSVATEHGAYYVGNSTDGEDVFIATREALTWQDHDAVMDVYTARVGGGIAQPPPAPECSVLADGCQDAGAGGSGVSRETAKPGGGNAAPGARAALSVGGLSAAQRRRAARSGVLPIRVKAGKAGLVKAVAKGRVGGGRRTLGRDSKRLRKAGRAVLKLRLSASAKRRLRAGKALRITVTVSMLGARTRITTIRLQGGKS